MHDPQGGRFHLLTSAEDWASCVEVPAEARHDTAPDDPIVGQSTSSRFEWDRRTGSLHLVHREPVLQRRRTGASVDLADRRGVDRDRYGTWFWISNDQRGIERLPSDGGRSAVRWWSLDEPGSRSSAGGDLPEDCGAGFAARGAETSGRARLAGLAITTGGYLAVGLDDGQGGLYLFDLLAGGAPTLLRWSNATVVPHDLAATDDGGLVVLDRANRSWWRLDRGMRLMAQVEADAAIPSFQPVDGSLAPPARETTVHLPRPLPGDGPHAVVDPIAIATGPDDLVFVLDRAPDGSTNVLVLRDGTATATFDLSVQAKDPTLLDGPSFTYAIAGHDLAFVPPTDGGNDPSGPLLFVADGTTAQTLAFELDLEGLELHARTDYFPMRRWEGRAVVESGGDVYYDANGRWVPLEAFGACSFEIEAVLRTPSFSGRDEADRVVGEPFDSAIPGCCWHRLFLDADIPSGASVRVRARASDDPELLTMLPFVDQPVPYLRSGGSELPHHDPWAGVVRPDSTKVGTWELLFQHLDGRYLELELTLQGTGRSTPSIRALRAWYPRFSFVTAYLPDVYQEEDEGARFLERMLANVEGYLTGLEMRLDAVPSLLDARTVPADAIEWLASWLGLTLEPAWTEDRRRFLIRYADRFYRRRGTVGGLLSVLRLYLGCSLDNAVVFDPRPVSTTRPDWSNGSAHEPPNRVATWRIVSASSSPPTSPPTGWPWSTASSRWQSQPTPRSTCGPMWGSSSSVKRGSPSIPSSPRASGSLRTCSTTPASPPATSAPTTPSRSPNASSPTAIASASSRRCELVRPPQTQEGSHAMTDVMQRCAPLSSGVIGPDLRVNYTFGLVLGVDEFEQEDLYFRERDERHGRSLHGYGTDYGLDVTTSRPEAAPHDVEVRVSEGIALDQFGRPIVIRSAQCGRIGAWIAEQEREARGASPDRDGSPLDAHRGDSGEVTVYVVARYDSCLDALVPIPGNPCGSDDEVMAASRIRDSWNLELRWERPDMPAWDGVRALADLLLRVDIDESEPPQSDEALLLEYVRALAPGAPQPGTELPERPVIPRAEARVAFDRLITAWVTAVRPTIEPDLIAPDGEAAILLASVTVVPATPFDPASPVITEFRPPDSEGRPYLAPTQLIQELALLGGGGDAIVSPQPRPVRRTPIELATLGERGGEGGAGRSGRRLVLWSHLAEPLELPASLTVRRDGADPVDFSTEQGRDGTTWELRPPVGAPLVDLEHLVVELDLTTITVADEARAGVPLGRYLDRQRLDPVGRTGDVVALHHQVSATPTKAAEAQPALEVRELVTVTPMLNADHQLALELWFHVDRDPRGAEEQVREFKDDALLVLVETGDANLVSLATGVSQTARNVFEVSIDQKAWEETKLSPYLRVLLMLDDIGVVEAGTSIRKYLEGLGATAPSCFGEGAVSATYVRVPGQRR